MTVAGVLWIASAADSIAIGAVIATGSGRASAFALADHGLSVPRYATSVVISATVDAARSIVDTTIPARRRDDSAR